MAGTTGVRRGSACHATGAGRRLSLTSAARVTSIATGLFESLFPPICVSCSTTVRPGRPPLCGSCESRLRSIPGPRCPRCGYTRFRELSVAGRCAECAEWPDALVRADSAFLFEPPAVRIVHGLKYAGWTSLAPRMGALMAPVARKLGTPDTVLVPVPLTPARLRERGFNQARLLADGVSAALGWRVEPLLRRASADRRQARSGRRERALNVAGAYHVIPSGVRAATAGLPGSGREALIVDDVITTGATIAACATALAGCGVRCLGAVSFARTPPRTPGG